MTRRNFVISAIVAVLLQGAAQSGRAGTIVEALSYALEAAQAAVKEGFTVREERWGGDLAAGQPLPIPQQLFKGNEYWFWMGTDSKGATISVHIYDKNGKLVEDEFWQKGQKAAARIRPKRTGTYYLLVEVEKSTDERTVWSLAYGFR